MLLTEPNRFVFMLVEKAAFAAIEASDEEFDRYEELEDDFLMIANEGKVALEVVEDDDPADKRAKKDG